MSLLNEAYRLRHTGGNESAAAAKKRKALARLDEMVEAAVYRAERAHQAKRAKAEAEFRGNPHWKAGWNRRGNRIKEHVHSGWIEKWKKIREGTYQDKYGCVWSVHTRELWLRERGLAPLSEEEEPSMDTLVRRYVDETVGTEAVVTLTTKLLRSIRDCM